MRLTNTFITLCCGLTVLAACKKSDTNSNSSNNNNSGNNTLTKTQLLVAGKWQLSASSATTNYRGKDTTIDTYSTMEQCDKDDFILFANDGTCTVDENANKCSYDAQIESFTWALLYNDTKLAIVDDNPDTMNVEELTSTDLKLKLTKLNSSGTPVIALYTYKNIR